MTCIKPDYSEEEAIKARELERLIQVNLEGLGPACIPIKPIKSKAELPKHDIPCPIYTDNSAALYRRPGEEID